MGEGFAVGMGEKDGSFSNLTLFFRFQGNLLCVMPCTDGTSAVDTMHAQVV